MPETEQSKRIAGAYVPALDGLRGLSIMMVLYSHISFGALPKALRATTLGNGGVILFFTISGYLITSQLISENRKTGTVNFPSFLIRRFFRLFNALVLMLCFVVILNREGWVVVSANDLAHGFTYTMDYYHPSSPVLEHLWSLSVEEQFYLLWPLCFLAFFTGSRLSLLVAVIVLSPCIRFVEWKVGVPGLFRHFECVADCLAIGCVLATINWPKVGTETALLCLGIMVICCYFDKTSPNSKILTITAEAGCAFFILAAALGGEGSWLNRALVIPPLRWMGRLSYSVYLWQQLFLLPFLPEHRVVHRAMFSLPWNLILTLIASGISYYAVEAPFRRVGKRFASRSGTAIAFTNVRSRRL